MALECVSMSAVEIYNAAGQLLSRHSFPDADSITISAPALPGLYLITAVTSRGRFSTRLLVA